MSKYNRYMIFSCIISMFMIWRTVSAQEDICGRVSTKLYETDILELSICHGSYMEIAQNSEQWQPCFDAEMYLKNKVTGKISKLVDCRSELGRAFRINRGDLVIRYFYTTYPEFDSEPLLIETQDIASGKKSYDFDKKFTACDKSEIDKAVEQINATLVKPFDGGTYFPAVYGGFYKLRDCAESSPDLVLSILRNYSQSGRFDGEVAETLTSTVEEVEMIRAAIMHK